MNAIEVFIQGAQESFSTHLSDAYLWLVALVVCTLASACYLVCKKGGPWIEIWRVLFRREFLASREYRVQAAYFAISETLVAPIVAGVISIYAVIGLGAAVAESFGEPLRPFADPVAVLAVQFLVFLVLKDFVAYVEHYFDHRIKLLWACHRVHHSAETMNVLVTVRGAAFPALFLKAPFRITADAFVGAAAIYLSGGAPPEHFAALLVPYYAVNRVLAMLAHVHVPIPYGVLEKVFISPSLHHVHHSAERRHWEKNYGCNYGGIFSIWDRLFGTLIVASPGEKFRFGINERELGANNPHKRLADYLIEPFIYSAKVVLDWVPSKWRMASRELGARSFALRPPRDGK